MQPFLDPRVQAKIEETGFLIKDLAKIVAEYASCPVTRHWPKGGDSMVCPYCGYGTHACNALVWKGECEQHTLQLPTVICGVCRDNLQCVRKDKPTVCGCGNTEMRTTQTLQQDRQRLDTVFWFEDSGKGRGQIRMYSEQTFPRQKG